MKRLPTPRGFGKAGLPAIASPGVAVGPARYHYVPVAQRIERLASDQEVRGSNPLRDAEFGIAPAIASSGVAGGPGRHNLKKIISGSRPIFRKKIRRGSPRLKSGRQILWGAHHTNSNW